MRPLIYMNNAATSWPKPDCVADAVSKALCAPPGSANRGGIEEFDVFEETRKSLAQLMKGQQYNHIALGANSTWGLNLAIQGFPLKEGDTVVATTAEHNSVLRPLYKLVRERHIKIILVPVDAGGRVCPELWEKACYTYKPALCVLTHASNVTGAINDICLLTHIAKQINAVVLIDASQTLGMVPVQVDDWNIDMLAFTGHKYLLGPQGTGGLYVKPGLQLEPLLCGGTGIQSDRKEMPPEMPIHLEAGTGNEAAYYGLLAALRWSEENPADIKRIELLTAHLKQGLADAGAAVIAPQGKCTPVVSFVIEGKSAAEIGYILKESYDIVCRSGLHCAPRIFTDLGCDSTVRLSLSRFTTEEEIEAVIQDVSSIMR